MKILGHAERKLSVLLISPWPSVGSWRGAAENDAAAEGAHFQMCPRKFSDSGEGARGMNRVGGLKLGLGRTWKAVYHLDFFRHFWLTDQTIFLMLVKSCEAIE